MKDVSHLNIEILADILVSQVKEILREAKTEEDLRIKFEGVLEPIKKELEITSRGEYERTIFGGRPDAVHGQVIIEYKKPKSFSYATNIDKAYEQLKKYLIGNVKKVGVGFDGEKIFFVRYINNAFYKEGPYDFNIDSARTFLIHLRGLARRSLTAENLAKKFGPQSELAVDTVRAFINSLKHWRNERITTFFNEWKRLFGIVYGEQFNSNWQKKEIEEIFLPYKVSKDTSFQEVFFSIHTYYALLMKLIAAEILMLRETSLASSFSSRLVHVSEEELKKELEDIESGSVYARKGITNFLEGDFFSWYLDALDFPELQAFIKEIARSLSEFEPATSTLDPDATRDLLKKLYQYLVPKKIRHRLGEYYTPDWLAELLLNEVGYDGDLSKRLLDPACGSGTFLVFAIKRAIKYGKEKEGKTDSETVKKIIRNIWGFDLNPLAVIASRTNYLFALGDLVNEVLDNKGEILEIPVYLCDSVLTPTRPTRKLYGKILEVHTSVGKFEIPAKWIEQEGSLLAKASRVIEEMVKNRYTVDEAMERLKEEGLVASNNEQVVKVFYKQILELEKRNKNGIWARFLKNAFAPAFAGKFDFVVGNPPWVRWDYLTQEYRNASLQLWKDYGLFSLKGFQARLGGGKKDFSMLFTYASADYYLDNGGKLGFLITQEVFKSKGAGEGFRRFYLGNGSYLKVLKVHDFVSIQPFEGATNKTALIILKKGDKTKYPVPYFVWTKKKGVGKIPVDKLLDEILPLLQKKEYYAKPIGSEVGPWQTQPMEWEEISGIKGQNYYKAILGANTSPYGVFWLEIKQKLSTGDLIIRNLIEEGKLNLDSVEFKIEQDLVYPAIRGSDIERWKANPRIFILLVQDPKTRRGYPEDFMKKNYPRTYSYLLKFKDILLNRPLYKKYHEQANAPFYSQFNISETTFAKYKVVWQRMSNDIYAAVISQVKTKIGYKTIIPLDTTAFFPVDNELEAHYLCAIINSKPVREFIKSFSSAGRGFGTPSVMKHIAIPKFDPQDPLHQELARISKRCHQLKTEGKEEDIRKEEEKNDELVKELFKQTKTKK